MSPPESSRPAGSSTGPRRGPGRFRDHRRGRGQSAEASREERLFAFCLAVAIPGYLALEEGGLDLLTLEQLGVFLWWGMALLLAFGVLPRARFPVALRLPAIFFSAFVGIVALAFAWTDYEGRAFAELARVIAYGGALAAVWLGVGKGTWRAAAGGLVVVALAVVVLAVMSRMFPLFFPDNGGEYRLAYPLGYWNALGAWSAMTVALGLSWSLGATGRVQRGLALALVPFAGVAVYLTYSRGAVLATVVGVVALVALSRNRRRMMVHAALALAIAALAALAVRSQPDLAYGSGDTGALLLLGVLLAGGGLCAWVATLENLRLPGMRERSGQSSDPPWAWFVAGTLVAVVLVAVVASPRIAATGEGVSDPVGFATDETDPAARLLSVDDVRPRLWSEAVSAWRSEPLTGIGPGAYSLWWERNGAPPPVRDAHSLYLQTLAELGALGLIALALLLISLLLAALAARRKLRRGRHTEVSAGLIAVGLAFVVQSGVDWLWEVPAVAVFGLASLGVAAMAAAEPIRGRRRGGLRVPALVAVAVVAGAAQVPDLVATRFERDSAILLARGDLPRALEAAEDAVEAEPWDSRPYMQRALVSEQKGRFGQAIADVRRALEREPLDWRKYATLARLRAKAGDDVGALRSFERSARLVGVPPEELDLTPAKIAREFRRMDP